MPLYNTTLVLSEPVARVFDFFRRPANLLRVTPPDWHLQLEDASDELQLGSRLTLLSRRWGMKQRSVTEIILFEPNVTFIEEQKEGAFRAWRYAHRFEATAEGGTRLRDEIDYELPGGMLGLLLTTAVVERELDAFFRYRNDALAEILANG